MWMYFRSLDLITDDHVAQQLELSIHDLALDYKSGELEVGGDQSVNIKGVWAIEHALEFSGASSPVDTEATHIVPALDLVIWAYH
jgi:hypothetical protein